MAAIDAACSPQFSSVVNGHRMAVLRVKAVNSDAVTAMFPAGAVQVTTTLQMNSDVAAAFHRSEENQIAGS